MADDTIRQVYMNIASKIQSCQKQLSQIEAQLTIQNREHRMSDLTKRELNAFGDDVPMYKSLGKMFIQESKENIFSDLKKTSENSKTMIDALEKKQKFVKRDLEEASGNMRDIIRATQASAASKA